MYLTIPPDDYEFDIYLKNEQVMKKELIREILDNIVVFDNFVQDYCESVYIRNSAFLLRKFI